MIASRIFVLLGIVAFMIYRGCMMTSNVQQAAPLTVWIVDKPYSLDPFDFDAAVHHVTQRPVFSALVSQYRAGIFTGVIASSWSNNADLTEWTFHLRQGLTFSNGAPITPEVVAKSLTRMAWLQHSVGSHSGLTEHLIGIEELLQADGHMVGISVSGTKLILSFKDPQPRLLETISFGLYSIVHSDDYDPKTGTWLNPRSGSASGPYALSSWTDERMEIVLRPDFPAELRHPAAPKEYKIVWDRALRGSTDLAMGGHIDSDLYPGKELHASGSTEVSILYVQAFSWNLAASPVADRMVRLCLRNEFYKALEREGVKPTRSFLPTSIAGIEEASDPATAKPSHTFKIKAVHPVPRSGFRGKVASSIETSVRSCGGDFVPSTVADVQMLRRNYDPNAKSYDVDVHTLMTGLLVEDPEGDVRFMVRSKEGIRLPDPAGRLAIETSKPKLDLAAINQILWDDAIVWPVVHYTDGIWASKGRFDFSLLNLNLPPTDLSWIGLK